MTGAPALAELAGRLRAAGLPVGAAASADFASASEVVGLSSRHDLYHALRSLSVASPEHLPVFDRVFNEFFSGRHLSGVTVVVERPRTWTIRPSVHGQEGEGEGEHPSLTARAGASTVERLVHRDFAELTPAEAAQVRALMASMLWRPSLVRSRRFRPAANGRRLDLRRTVRDSVGSDLIELAMAEPRLRRRPLLVIADVSGSMEQYAEMILYFAHAAQGRLGRLEAFVFSTRLTRITRQLRRRSAAEAIAEVSRTVDDWSGGTRIGEALAAFNFEWSRRVTRGGPVAILVSDGWERGDPLLLRAEMARLRRTVHRLVWLNPLAGRPGFAPETRGMKAALPYIDDFLPAANLSDLESLIALLESIPAHR